MKTMDCRGRISARYNLRDFLMLRYYLITIFFCFFSVNAFCTADKTADKTIPDADKAALTQLAEILENPEQRSLLINQLRAIAEKDAADTHSSAQSEKTAEKEEQTTAPAAQKVEPDLKTVETNALQAVADNTREVLTEAVDLPKQIAEKSAEIVGKVGGRIEQSARILMTALRGDDYRLKWFNWRGFGKAVAHLGMIIVATLALYQGLRRVSVPLKNRLHSWVLAATQQRRLLYQLVAISIMCIVDMIFIGVTYFTAQFITLHIVGENGSLSLQSNLFLTAFMILELIKVGVRTVFYDRYSGLRLLRCDNRTAHYWYHWIGNIINLVGYGYMVAIPLINTNISNSLGQVSITVIALAAFIYGVCGVMKNRTRLQRRFYVMSRKTKFGVGKIFLRLMAALWHWFALAYFMMLLVVTLLQAEQSLPFVLQGTLRTILSIGGGLLISMLLTQLIGQPIELSEEWRRYFPGMEARLNAYIPLFLRLMRMALLIAVILLTLSAWHVISVQHWLASSEGQKTLNTWLGAVMIAAFIIFVWMIVAAIIEHRLSAYSSYGEPSARAKTLLSLIKNALAVILFIIGLMLVLSQIGINIGPLIAGAGVVGLAVGFGAQTLVKDVITGIFIQIENAMNTGDFVTVAGISGTAERISIRSVGLRDAEGTYHVIPFSSVSTVSNYMRGFAYHCGEYRIGYAEDIDQAYLQLKAAFDELRQGAYRNSILDELNIAGVVELGNSAVVIRAIIKTTPGDQWAVGRAYNRLVKIYFDRAGIEIPYPHQTLYLNQLKEQSSFNTVFKTTKPAHSDVKNVNQGSVAEKLEAKPDESPEKQLIHDSKAQVAKEKAEETSAVNAANTFSEKHAVPWESGKNQDENLDEKHKST